MRFCLSTHAIVATLTLGRHGDCYGWIHWSATALPHNGQIYVTFSNRAREPQSHEIVGPTLWASNVGAFIQSVSKHD
jgi:hypothetical protein